MQTLEPIIAKHTFFKGLEPAYLQLITGCASNVSFGAGTYMFREGEDATRFYLIRQGRVALELFAVQRGPVIIETIEAGEVLGWSWLFPPYRWHFSGRVVEPVRAIALDGRCLCIKSDEDHNLGYELMQRVAQVMIERLQATRLRLLDIYSNRPGGSL